MKPNYLSFRSKVLNHFRVNQNKSTTELDSLDRAEIAADLESSYQIDHDKIMDLLYTEMTVDNFIKAAYKLID